MEDRKTSLTEIALTFLKIGAVSYGGPAIMGIMQNELQEKRQWLGKQQFVDGLSLVNMLPGPLATQLGIYIGHAKQGIAGGIVAGLAFSATNVFVTSPGPQRRYGCCWSEGRRRGPTCSIRLCGGA